MIMAKSKHRMPGLHDISSLGSLHTNNLRTHLVLAMAICKAWRAQETDPGPATTNDRPLVSRECMEKKMEARLLKSW